MRRKRRAAQCSRSFHPAERTLEGVEEMQMMHKGQVKGLIVLHESDPEINEDEKVMG